jgi:hypothetical protein
MKSKSIKSHLSEFSIYQKRKTTIANAFASARAPQDLFALNKAESLLKALGQADMEQLTCVYCGKPAQTWDHLVGLVKNGKLRADGYGHQIGNLVPCCKTCNSQKAGKPFEDYVKSLGKAPSDQDLLLKQLHKHLSSAKRIDTFVLDTKAEDALEKYDEKMKSILNLMRQADELAKVIREGSS